MTMIRFDEVTFGYDKNCETSSIIEEVSFCVSPGELVGIAGRNGSGKSTIALLAAGILLPLSGKVLVDEHDTVSLNPEIQRKVGILFQNPDQQIVGTTPEEDIAFGLENLAIPREEMRKRIDDAAGKFELTEYLQKPVNNLSGGTKQKLALASIMAMGADYLILDEPTSQLDPWFRVELWNIIRRLREERNLGIIVISQHPSDLEFIERVIVLHDKKIVIDAPVGKAWSVSELSAWGVRPPEEWLFRRAIADTGDNIRHGCEFSKN